MKNKFYFFILILTTELISCNQKISSEKLNGKFENKDWQYVTAVAIENLSDTGEIQINFFDEEIEAPCDNSVNENFISILCPKKVGKYEFASNQLIAFFNQHRNTKIASEGIIEITEIDLKNNLAKGKILATADEENFVNGTFEAKYCPNKNLDDFLNEMENTLDTLMKN